MWTKAFWLAALERAAKTVAQSALAGLLVDRGTAAALSWQQILIAAGVAGLISLLVSMVGSGVGPKGSPSLVADPAAAEAVVPEVVRDMRARRWAEDRERGSGQSGGRA